MLLLVLNGATAMGPPRAAISELADLLHVHMDHVPGMACDDLPW